MLVKVTLRSKWWDVGESESQVWDEIEYYESLVEIPNKSRDADECEYQVQVMGESQVPMMSYAYFDVLKCVESL